MIGAWSWRRVQTSYPELLYWAGDGHGSAHDDLWVGVLDIRKKQGEQFYLFSYLSSLGNVGQVYLASTKDMKLLSRFADDAYKHLHDERPGRISILSYGGQELTITSEDDEVIFLDAALQNDIDEQVAAFFQNGKLFRDLRIPYRRGFLFVGSPGTGKTMTIRHLIRQCHRRYSTCATTLSISCSTNVHDIEAVFDHAARSSPSILVLEDMDSLTNQSRVTRSALLAQLDGLASREGLLVIGTTNLPEQIDPALLQRPSRFDRVWKFPLPNQGLRLRYLHWAFAKADNRTLTRIACQTANWSFAYLKELRTTAGILAVTGGYKSISEVQILAAYELLATQFHATRSPTTLAASDQSIGFVAA
jgi:ATP-dependent Zn protease